MTTFKKRNMKKITTIFLIIAVASGCTKLDQQLNNTLTNAQTADALGASFVLQTAYNDIGNPYSDPGNIFALEEVTADQCVVPTRLGDWDDNGKWRDLKKHSWKTDGIDIISNMFNGLNKITYDATNVLVPAFKATEKQKAEARFLRAIALYQLLDLYGQFPYREPGENLLNAPKVFAAQEGIDFIISELESILPNTDASNPKQKANPEAVKTLLMKCYINKGAFINRANPTFSDADMQKVITLGNEIMGSGKYSYSANYFDNFNPTNSGSTEAIFACPNTAGVATNNTRIDNRWWATVHYNQYQSVKGAQGGWNGFSTVADFYNSFGVNKVAKQTPEDTLLDPRIGGRFYKGCTDISGVRPGLLIGQQYNEKGVKYNDRNGNLLIFDPNIKDNLREDGADLELKGIRAVKYVPDYSDGGKNYGNQSGNWLILFRYSDVVLMVAEAKMRTAVPDNAGALAMVNALRSARGTDAMPTMTLVNPDNVSDPKTLLAERGRELYWEVVRRTDLIRFGVFQKPWYLKPASDATHLLFPIPSGALASNPNLKQNPGYN